MSFIYRISIILLILSTCSVARSMTLKSDSLIFDDYLKRVDATGNVQLVIDDATILGDHLMFYVDDNLVVSSGNVVIKRQDDEVKSHSILINLDEKKLHLYDLKLGITPYEKKGQIYVTIKTLIDGEKRKLGKYARFTTCNAIKPHYYLFSWRFLYYPDKSLHLFGAQFRNDLSFFPFNIIPFPIPLIEWIPIPYYYYQLGERKVVLHFPTIGEKKSDGWGLFVQNKLDYRYHNEKESSLFLDWYQAKQNRSGEWGYGIHHYYGNDIMNGDFYIYNYDFKVGSDTKRNFTYKLNNTITYKEASLSGTYRFVDVDERINSTGTSHTIDKSFSLNYSPYVFPLRSTYKEKNNLSNQFQSQQFNFKKEFLHQQTTFSLNKKNYSSSQRHNTDSKLNHSIEFPLNFNLNQSIHFNENHDKATEPSAEQTLTYISKLSTTLPKHILMTVDLTYLYDLDHDRVTSDIKSGINNYLYKLPEISFSQKQSFFKSHQYYSFNTNSVFTLGNYREVRYLDDDPDYAFPELNNLLEPNMYFFKQTVSKSFLSLPASSKLTFSSTYEQYIFKNDHKSLFEGDAQYSLNYDMSLNSTFFSFMKHSTSYSRKHGHKDNNSPFYAFNNSITEVNRLSEKITFFYKKKRSIRFPFSFDFTWDHSTAYNWLRSSDPYSNYRSNIAIVFNKIYKATLQSSKNLNKKWKKESNLFTPLIFSFNGNKKDKFKFNYLLQLNMNDLVFDKIYIVKNSNLNFQVPFGRNPDFKWNLKGYFNYIEPGQPFKIDGYQFQKFSVIKDEHERQIEIGYNKTIKEIFFKFHFKMFSKDPLVLRQTNNVIKFEGRLNKKSEERF
tara:strand:- start:1279 stop:3783 length:2505 start_codon:yes stop_codon:yes gene_type:complete